MRAVVKRRPLGDWLIVFASALVGSVGTQYAINRTASFAATGAILLVSAVFVALTSAAWFVVGRAADAVGAWASRRWSR